MPISLHLNYVILVKQN